MTHDLIVVGGGPGGYVAAIRARQLGLKTALVEAQHLGGICLNWGCIPTKGLLRTAEVYHLLRHADVHGFSLGEVRVDLGKLVARSRAVAKKLASGVKFLMKKHAVEVFDGWGRLDGPGRLIVEKDGQGIARLEAPHIILATGARARALPNLQPDGERIWTYREAMVPERLPGAVLIVGAGAIGVEFASFYADMGSRVTLVEALEQILPAEDAEIAGLARTSFEKRGISIHSGATLQAVEPHADGLTATLDLGKGLLSPITVNAIILAVGIAGNVEHIGLETTRARVEKGHVVVDEWLATDEPGLYAIGDLAGPPWLAHKASHEGVLCVEHLAGVPGVEPLAPRDVPACTYCRPQVASLGLTEAAARAAGRTLRVGRFPYQANGKAIAMAEPEGLVKTIFDADSGELLGAHLFGADATELIGTFALARTLESTEAELMRTVFPHPTLSEMIGEATLAAWDRALNV
ncbi:MAG: dihydrolipoyl dehydrogenase [Deltaproteobacteria bacterium]|nr:dihydrolipoyl dehydrogenase [Deltaproteobacteria bacterium]